MVKLVAQESFQLTKIDLNWYSRNYYDEARDPNANVTLEGKTYRTTLAVNGFNSGADFYDDFYLWFAGASITGSVKKGTVSGTVQALGEFSTDGGASTFFHWGLYGASVSAKTILAAAKTKSTADDVALIKTALGGADHISLSDYDDNVNGFGGKDTIYGNSGVDVLQGGAAVDHLYGGADADRFVFDDGETGKGSARDIIFDFFAGEGDVLDLRQIDANSKKSGDQAFVFRDTTAAKNAVWYGVSGDNIIVYGDVNGDAKADFEIELRDTFLPTGSDFLL